MHCPIQQPVYVREYDRVRNGQCEHVRQHCRRAPQR